MLSNDNFLKKLERLSSKETTATEKNNIALELSETNDFRVLHTLHDLIKNRSYTNHRGTFVYCLRFFDPYLSFNLLIDLIINGNYEVSHEAYDVLNNVDCEMKNDNIKKNYMKINQFISKNEEIKEWRKDILYDTLDMFD